MPVEWNGAVKTLHTETPDQRISRYQARYSTPSKYVRKPRSRNDECFQIVIEAYNFVFDAFGLKGGIAAIDDIRYHSAAIYNCLASKSSFTKRHRSFSLQ